MKFNKFKDSVDISQSNMFNSDVSRLRSNLEGWDEIYVEEKEVLGNRAIAPDQSNWMLMNDAPTEFNDANLPDHMDPPKEPKTNWIGAMKKITPSGRCFIEPLAAESSISKSSSTCV